MKLSVLANLYGALPLEEALKKLSALGIDTIEIGGGGYPGKDHCDPAVLLSDESAYQKFIDTLKKYNMTVCAIGRLTETMFIRTKKLPQHMTVISGMPCCSLKKWVLIR